MKRNLLFSLLIFPAIIIPSKTVSNINETKTSEKNYIVLSNKQKEELFQNKSFSNSYDIHKFCFRITKSNKSSKTKNKLINMIQQNVDLVKNRFPNKWIEHAYMQKPQEAESEYLRRVIEITAIYLLNGTTCHCCVPVNTMKKEHYFILTGKELCPTDEVSKLNYTEFQNWVSQETEKFHDKLNQNN